MDGLFHGPHTIGDGEEPAVSRVWTRFVQGSDVALSGLPEPTSALHLYFHIFKPSSGEDDLANPSPHLLWVLDEDTNFTNGIKGYARLPEGTSSEAAREVPHGLAGWTVEGQDGAGWIEVPNSLAWARPPCPPFSEKEDPGELGNADESDVCRALGLGTGAVPEDEGRTRTMKDSVGSLQLLEALGRVWRHASGDTRALFRLAKVLWQGGWWLRDARLRSADWLHGALAAYYKTSFFNPTWIRTFDRCNTVQQHVRNMMAGLDPEHAATHEKKPWLVHIPKTAGRFVRRVLAAAGDAGARGEGAGVFGVEHHRLALLRLCAPEALAKVRLVAVVRDPWARVVSAWRYLKGAAPAAAPRGFDPKNHGSALYAYQGFQLDRTQSFGGFVREVLADLAPWAVHLIPQVEYLREPDAQELPEDVDVQRYEALFPKDTQQQQQQPRSSSRRTSDEEQPPEPLRAWLFEAECDRTAVATKKTVAQGGAASLGDPDFSKGGDDDALRRPRTSSLRCPAEGPWPVLADAEAWYCPFYREPGIAEIVAEVYKDDAQWFGYRFACPAVPVMSERYDSRSSGSGSDSDSAVADGDAMDTGSGEGEPSDRQRPDGDSGGRVPGTTQVQEGLRALSAADAGDPDDGSGRERDDRQTATTVTQRKNATCQRLLLKGFDAVQTDLDGVYIRSPPKKKGTVRRVFVRQGSPAHDDPTTTDGATSKSRLLYFFRRLPQAAGEETRFLWVLDDDDTFENGLLAVSPPVPPTHRKKASPWTGPKLGSSFYHAIDNMEHFIRR